MTRRDYSFLNAYLTKLQSLKMKTIMERNLVIVRVTSYFVITEWVSVGNSIQIKITGFWKKYNSSDSSDSYISTYIFFAYMWLCYTYYNNICIKYLYQTKTNINRFCVELHFSLNLVVTNFVGSCFWHNTDFNWSRKNSLFLKLTALFINNAHFEKIYTE